MPSVPHLAAPPGVYVRKPSERMVLGQMREELLKRLAWHLPYACRVDCAWSLGREQAVCSRRKECTLQNFGEGHSHL